MKNLIIGFTILGLGDLSLAVSTTPASRASSQEQCSDRNNLVSTDTVQLAQALRANVASSRDSQEVARSASVAPPRTQALAAATPQARKPADFANRPRFMNACNPSVSPSVYNPKLGGIEGGKSTRMNRSEHVISIEDAARTGQPVTIAMDYKGEFGKRCNWKSNDGTRRRTCLVLVELPGLDDPKRGYPSYRDKFPLLPKDSFIALIEDTGGDFVGRGTKRMDVPFKTGRLFRSNSFTSAQFEVLDDPRYAPEDGKKIRQMNFANYRPFGMNGRQAKCNWKPERKPIGGPVMDNSLARTF